MSVSEKEDEAGTELSSGALERGLQVLEAVRSALVPITLSGIVAATGLDTSTVHRSLRILQKRGYVFRIEPSKAYTVGRALLAPTGLTDMLFNFRRDMHDHLVHLMASTRMTATLMVLVGPTRLSLDIVTGKDRLVPYNSAEIMGPLHSTVSGKLWLLAQPPAAARAALEERQLVRFTPTTRDSVEAVIADLDASRQRGYVETRDETIPGVFGLAAPLRANSGRIMGGIGLYASSRWVTDAVAADAAAQLVAAAMLANQTAASLDAIDRYLG